jgi:hypothetical protein
MPVISNTSPLLYLHQVHQLDLLRLLYGEVWIPHAVASELKAGAAIGISIPAIDEIVWVRPTPVRNRELIPLVTDLGPGEAETIALAIEHPDSLAIIDDQLGRRVARAAGLRFTGTLGVLLKAKRSGLISSVASVITALRGAGMWIGKDLATQVIAAAGE